MNSHFSSHSRYTAENETFSRPPRAFEEFNKVSGISGRYVFPNQMSANEYETKLRADHLDIWEYYTYVDDVMHLSKEFPKEKLDAIRQLKDELVELNPVLASIPCDENSPQELFDILFGAASCINAPDIAFFLERRKDKAPSLHAALQDDDYRSLYESVSNHKHTKSRLSWVPSKETLLHISKQLQLRAS